MSWRAGTTIVKIWTSSLTPCYGLGGSTGVSRQLYCDNAKVYHAHALQFACTTLNIELLHRPPRDPAPGGIIERVIQTTQEQFEAEVRAGKILSLSELNRYFQAWLSASYHQTVHSQTGQAPQNRFDEGTRFQRRAELANVREFFHVREQRIVEQEFSDVRVNNQFYRVDSKYRGDQVIVSYDPFSRDLTEVRLFSLRGEHLQVAPRYNRERGAHPEPDTPAPQPPLDHHYLDMLLQEQLEQQSESADAGLDYHAAMHQQQMSLTRLIHNVARLLGRRGGVSSLRTDEIELLAQVHVSLPHIHLSRLEQAFELAETKSVAALVFSFTKTCWKKGTTNVPRSFQTQTTAILRARTIEHAVDRRTHERGPLQVDLPG